MAATGSPIEPRERRDIIQKKIQSRAERIGNKSSNLVELQEVSEAIARKLGTKIEVPEILPLPHQAIFDHLDRHAPAWKKHWESFKAKQGKEKSLVSGAIEELETIQKIILKTFEEHPFSDESLSIYLKSVSSDKDTALMVRSTGKEDTLEIANPGGNESVAAVKADRESISNAIGTVVASYFGTKSFQQRLLGGQSVTEPPFMPVLIQKMIGERVLKIKLEEIKQDESKEKKEEVEPTSEKRPSRVSDVVISGVMYTHSEAARIQMAPGHGELIVNSKAPFDTFFVTNQDVVHAEIYQKKYRLAPIETLDKGKQKRTLAFHKNPKDLSDKPCVSSKVALMIATVGREIEAHYGMPMDVEFVFDPKSETLSLVQARPIPKGDLRLVIPSSIPPEKVKLVKEKGAIEKTTVISTAGNAAHIITDPSEILICHDIETALKIYLAQKDSKIKAVIIKQMAPSTSHEAAQFNSKAIPVLQTDNIEKIEDFLKKPAVLIVDPQRRQIIDWTANVSSISTAKEDIEKQMIIKEGLFKSSLSPRSSILPIFEKLEGSIDLKKTKLKIEHETSPSPVSSSSSSISATIGGLIEKIKTKETAERQEAFDQLMRQFYQLLPKKLESSRDGKSPIKKLADNLEVIESAVEGSSNKECHEALHQIMSIFFILEHYSLHPKVGKTRKSGEPTGLFQQAFVKGAEIYLALETLTHLSSTTPKEEIDKKKQALLDLVSKLEALITDPSGQHLLSNSIIQMAEKRKLIKLAEKVMGYERLSPEAKKYFVEFLKIKKLALNPNTGEAWVKFVLFCCRNPTRMQWLAKVTDFYFQNGIESDWLNTSFNKYAKKWTDENNQTNMPKLLKELLNDSLKTKHELSSIKLMENQSILDAWERRVGAWSDPKQFDKMWSEYESTLIPLIERLSIAKGMQSLTQQAVLKMVQSLAEIMDKSIKSLKGSPEYKENKKIQIERFARLLEPYHQLMKKWVNYLPESLFKKWSELVLEKPEANSKESILKAISDVFDRCKGTLEPQQMLSSGRLNVSSVKVGSTASFYRQFVQPSKHLTLEDLFSVMHQNILASTLFLGESEARKKEDYPREMQNIMDCILSLKIVADPLLTRSATPSTISPDLLSTTHRYPSVTTEFNLPLRNHSGKFLLKYNQETKKSLLQVKLFGHNGGGRMDKVVQGAKLAGLLQGFPETTLPRYDAKEMTLEFSWQIGEGQTKQTIERLQAYLKIFSEGTFITKDTIVNEIINLYPREETGKFYEKLLANKELSSNIEFSFAFAKKFLEDLTEGNPMLKNGKAQEILLSDKNFVSYLNVEDSQAKSLVNYNETKLSEQAIKVLIDLKMPLFNLYSSPTELMAQWCELCIVNAYFHLLPYVKAQAETLKLEKDSIEKQMVESLNKPYPPNFDTALMQAARKNNPTIVNQLLNLGAKETINLKKEDGVTALTAGLFTGSERANPEIIRSLLKAGADPNLGTDMEGRSPLISAVRTGDIDIVKMMVEAGAIINTSKENLDPIIAAKRIDNQEMIDFLSDALKKQEKVHSGVDPSMSSASETGRKPTF